MGEGMIIKAGEKIKHGDVVVFERRLKHFWEKRAYKVEGCDSDG